MRFGRVRTEIKPARTVDTSGEQNGGKETFKSVEEITVTNETETEIKFDESELPPGPRASLSDYGLV